MARHTVNLLVQSTTSRAGHWYAQVNEDKGITTLLFFKRETPRSLFTWIKDALNGVTSGRRAAEKYLSDLGWQARGGSQPAWRASVPPPIGGTGPSSPAEPAEGSAGSPMHTLHKDAVQASTQYSRHRSSADRKAQEIRTEAHKKEQDALRKSAKAMEFVWAVNLSDDTARLPSLNLEKGRISAADADQFIDQLSKLVSTRNIRWTVGTYTNVTLQSATRPEETQRPLARAPHTTASAIRFANKDSRKLFIDRYLEFMMEDLDPDIDAEDLSMRARAGMNEMIDTVLAAAEGTASPDAQQQAGVEAQLSRLRQWPEFALEAGELSELWRARRALDG